MSADPKEIVNDIVDEAVDTSAVEEANAPDDVSVPDDDERSLDDVIEEDESETTDEYDVVDEASGDESIPSDEYADPDQDGSADTGVEFPPELLAETGLTAESAGEYFASPEALQKYHADLQAAAVRNMMQQHQQQQPEPQQPPAEQAVPEPEDLFPAYELPDIEKGYDDDTLSIVNGISEHYTSQIDELSQMIGELSSRQALEQQAANEAAMQQARHEFGAAVEGLGEEYGEVFGKGGARTQEQIQRMYQLEYAAASVEAFRQQQGRPPLSSAELVKHAALVEFPDIHKAAVEKRTSGAIAKRQAQFTSRPTARKSDPLNGTNAAIAAADNFYRSKGLRVPPRAHGEIDSDGV